MSGNGRTRLTRENSYQRVLIRRLEHMFPGCYILKNDSGHIQGVPDLLILYYDRWAMLEVKADEHSPVRPNQEYYVEQFNHMSFASFISPATEEGVLYELQRALESGR